MATYLVVWLICKWVIGIESGFITLIISLGAAVVIYVVIGIKVVKKTRVENEATFF
ncbi:MAG: hypothetical protein JRC86_09370 [Deltaproteobacteria bacterium]|nr:hypothetical protein [Deltaproteobacteria bacterium]